MLHLIVEPIDYIIDRIYLPPLDNLDKNLALLELAFDCVTVVAPIENRLTLVKKAKTLKDVRNFAGAVEKGVIATQEMKMIQTANKLRARVGAVDDFETLGQCITQQKGRDDFHHALYFSNKNVRHQIFFRRIRHQVVAG